MQIAANSIKRQSTAIPGPNVFAAALRAGAAVTMAVAAVFVVLAAAWLLALSWLSAQARVGAPGPATTDELLALGAATVAVSIAAWLCLGTALEVLSHVPGRVGLVAGEWADRLTPALARRVAAFILGVGVGVAGGPPQAVAGPRTSSASTVTASATPADPGFLPSAAIPASGTQSAPPVDPGFGGLLAPPGPQLAPAPAEPGFTPTAPRVRPQADPGLLGARPQSPAEREVVVHRGDSLWSIAAAQLGPDASDAEIARAWPQWFEANTDRIGDDPDLLLPGQILRVPRTDQAVSETR